MRAQSSPDRGGVLGVGVLLVVVGLGAIGLQRAGFAFANVDWAGGWPFLVVVPGLILFASSFLLSAPRGAGLAIAGSIVTVVGLVLFYQQSTEHWESWAYAWVLVGPGAAGLGLLIYGLLCREGALVRVGLRLVTIAAVIFVLGFWFFESIYRTGRVPGDLEMWWPVAVIGIGLVVLIGGIFGSSGRRSRV